MDYRVKKGADGVPVVYQDRPAILQFRENLQRTYCHRAGVAYLIPEGQTCPKCKSNIYAYSPMIAPWDKRQVTKCYWCNYDLMTYKALQQAKSATSAK